MSITFQSQINNFKKLSKIGFKANNNSLIADLPIHTEWREPNLIQRAINLRYPAATAIAVTGLALASATGISATNAAMMATLPTIMSADVAATLIDKKRIPQQGLSEHESGHWIVNNSQVDQRYSTGITITPLPTRLNPARIRGYCSYNSNNIPNPTREIALKQCIGNAASADAPGALSELKRGYSVPLPLSGLAGDFPEVIRSTWKASGITSGDNGITPRRVADFCQITSGVRETSKALIRQHDPQLVEGVIDYVRTQGGLNFEQSNAIASKYGIYRPMPELSPQLKAKLLQGKQ